MPERIQRKRTKGWRMPENTVYVGRPTKWGNPFKMGAWGACGCRNCVTFEFEAHLATRGIACVLHDLRGKNLACWCSLGGPCHADILLVAANWSDQTEKTKTVFKSLTQIGEAIDALADQ